MLDDGGGTIVSESCIGLGDPEFDGGDVIVCELKEVLVARGGMTEGNSKLVMYIPHGNNGGIERLVPRGGGL